MKLFFAVFVPYVIGATTGLAYLKWSETKSELSECEAIIGDQYAQVAFVADHFRTVLERIDDRRPRCEFHLGVGEFDGRDLSDVVSGIMSRMDCTGGVRIYGSGIDFTTITDFDFSALSEQYEQDQADR